MKLWRLGLLGTIVAGSAWLAGCGSEDGKKTLQQPEAGAGGEPTSATEAGAGHAPSEMPAIQGGAGGESSTGAAGSPQAEGGQPLSAAGAPNGAAGEGTGATRLTSCDAPLVVDDAAEASIAPNQPMIFQAAGGLTLLVWREGAYRKARVLRDDDTLGSVITFPIIANSSDQIPHYVASGAGRLVYLDWEHNSVTAYDAESDTWSDPDVHPGLYFDLVQFLASGDTLHVVTDAIGSVGSLQTRSATGAWSTATPVWNFGADKISVPELLLNGDDDGALVAGRQPNAFALVGWAIRNGEVVAEASLPIDSYLASIDSALLPNGDVLAVFQGTSDVILRAATLSYDPDQDTASWSEPIELVQVASQISGLAVDSRGDATLVYGLDRKDEVRRRINGTWTAPTELPFSENWWGDPLVDANDTVFLARALDEYKGVPIISSAAGESTWSEALDVVGDFGWTYAQRPRLGLHVSGHPMVIWQGSNASGGSDILLSVCR